MEEGKRSRHKDLQEPYSLLLSLLYFLWLETTKVVKVAQLCPTFCDFMDCSLPALSMEFSRQEYWRGLLFPSPGIFLTQGLNPGFLHC